MLIVGFSDRKYGKHDQAILLELSGLSARALQKASTPGFMYRQSWFPESYVE